MTTTNEGKRQIEVVEPNGFKDGVIDRNEGDIYWEDPIKAADWIKFGWCKCVKTGEVGERKPGTNGPISPDNIVTVMQNG